MESETGAPSTSNIYHPPRPVGRRVAEPILYLAEKMARADQEVAPRETRVVDMIADAAGLPTFRTQPWYRDMTEAAALERINSELAKRALLVVLSLVLKADVKRKPAEHVYFSELRSKLGAEPITVPVDVDAHKALALEYFAESTGSRGVRR